MKYPYIVGKKIADKVRVYDVLECRSRHCTERQEYKVRVVGTNTVRWIWEETFKKMWDEGNLQIVS